MAANQQIMAAQVIASGAAPGFGAEITITSPGGASSRWQESASTSTTVITVSAAAALGTRVVLPITIISGSQTLTSVTDSRSNTYSVHVTRRWNTNYYLAVASAHVTTALQSGDTITLTWGTPNFSQRWGAVFYLTNCASSGQPDVTGSAEAFGSSVSATGTTVTANTAAIGLVVATGNTQTYGSGNWTTIGAALDYGNPSRAYFIHKEPTSAASQDPGGTWTASVDWGCVWAAFK